MPRAVREAEAVPWSVPSTESRRLFAQAQSVIAGGVQGEGRYCEPYPLYMEHGDGAYLRDVDGNEYIDFHSSFGAIILGHNHPVVRRAIQDAVSDYGTSFATPHPREVELAELLTEHVPCAERVVFACTGSEVTYHALRLARAATGRSLILKFDGNYHGWHDYVSWSSGPARAERGSASTPDPVPDSAGIPPGMESTVVVCQFNDVDALREIVNQRGDELAAIVVEPVFHNAGVIEPSPGFLEECRRLASQQGSVLIFDEIITGFRHGLGGAQAMLGVTPDLATFGKAFANGMPISMLAGKQELMEQLAPLGPVFFSGTFCGHALNVSAALACTRELAASPPYERLSRLGERLRDGVAEVIAENEVAMQIRQLGSVWAIYFSRQPIENYRDLADTVEGTRRVQSLYQRSLASRGIYVHPMSILRGYITASHSEADIDAVVEATASFIRERRSELATVAAQ